MKTQLSFQQATEALQRFLAEQQRPATLQWFFRDDLLFYKHNVFFRWPLPQDNQHSAETLFQLGREKGLGLALDVFCFDKHRAYCYVRVPEDEIDAEYMMMTDLKLSFATFPLQVWKIRTSGLWYILRCWINKRTNVRYELIPCKPINPVSI